jgi:hypothetical protein
MLGFKKPGAKRPMLGPPQRSQFRAEVDRLLTELTRAMGPQAAILLPACRIYLARAKDEDLYEGLEQVELMVARLRAARVADAVDAGVH